MVNSRKAQKGRRTCKISAKHKGRPQFAPSKEEREDVEVMAALNRSEEVIALSIGVSRGTLLKHFRYELDKGRAVRQREIDRALYNAAKGGNVAAIKEFRKQSEPVILSQPAAQRAEKLGKKEAAQLAAETAGVGTDWGNDLVSPTDKATIN